MSGIYDQLAKLNHQTTDEDTPVSSPTPSKTGGDATNRQSPILKENAAKKKPTTAHKESELITNSSTPQITSEITSPRENPRERSREDPRGNSRELPTRDEVQEFSFSLRDELKVKVQAEVPHAWQDELEEVSRKMDVKKLELYRFILGEFLGKVRRKKAV
jgi:hypothetical protein